MLTMSNSCRRSAAFKIGGGETLEVRRRGACDADVGESEEKVVGTSRRRGGGLPPDARSRAQFDDRTNGTACRPGAGSDHRPRLNPGFREMRCSPGWWSRKAPGLCVTWAVGRLNRCKVLRVLAAWLPSRVLIVIWTVKFR